MTQAAVIGFAVSFVAGPVLCALLLRLRSSVAVLLALAAGVLVSMACALWLEARAPLTALALMWLGWILALAMVGHALYRRATPGTRRWITLGAILATPLPWFGLAAAQLMSQGAG
jgi:hypothetical protein